MSATANELVLTKPFGGNLDDEGEALHGECALPPSQPSQTSLLFTLSCISVSIAPVRVFFRLERYRVQRQLYGNSVDVSRGHPAPSWTLVDLRSSPTLFCLATPSRSTRPTGRLSAASGACSWAGALMRPPMVMSSVLPWISSRPDRSRSKPSRPSPSQSPHWYLLIARCHRLCWPGGLRGRPQVQGGSASA